MDEGEAYSFSPTERALAAPGLHVYACDSCAAMLWNGWATKSARAPSVRQSIPERRRWLDRPNASVMHLANRRRLTLALHMHNISDADDDKAVQDGQANFALDSPGFAGGAAGNWNVETRTTSISRYE